jgi:hypothetical protein
MKKKDMQQGQQNTHTQEKRGARPSAVGRRRCAFGNVSRSPCSTRATPSDDNTEKEGHVTFFSIPSLFSFLLSTWHPSTTRDIKKAKTEEKRNERSLDAQLHIHIQIHAHSKSIKPPRRSISMASCITTSWPFFFSRPSSSFPSSCTTQWDAQRGRDAAFELVSPCGSAHQWRDFWYRLHRRVPLSTRGVTATALAMSVRCGCPP